MRNVFGVLLFSVSLFAIASQHGSEEVKSLLDNSRGITSADYDVLSSLQDTHLIDQNCVNCFNPVMKKLVIVETRGEGEGNFFLKLLGEDTSDQEEIAQLDFSPQVLSLVLDNRLRRLFHTHEPKVLVCSSGGIDEYTINRLCGIGCKKGWSLRHIVDEGVDPNARVHFTASYDGRKLIRGVGPHLKIYSSDSDILLDHQFQREITGIDPIIDDQGDMQSCNRLSITTSGGNFTTHWQSRSVSYSEPECVM